MYFVKFSNFSLSYCTHNIFAMNFLSEVLSTAEESQMINIKEKLPVIVKQITILKKEVKKYMEHAYVDFKIKKKKSYNLHEDAMKLNDDMEDLQKCFGGVKKSIDSAREEIINLVAEQKQASYSLKIASNLVCIHRSLKNLKKFEEDCEYLKAANEISLIRNYISDISDNKDLDIMKGINVVINSSSEVLVAQVTCLWNEFVTLEKQELDNKRNISLKINVGKTDRLRECMKVLSFNKSDIVVLNKLAKFLLEHIFNPIINHTLVMEIYKEDSISILNLSYDVTSSKMNCKHVFHHIQKVFEYLHLKINFEINNDKVVMNYIGDKINTKFCDILIKNCLTDTIPSTPEGLEKYGEVIASIVIIQDLCIECQFFSASNTSILEYANNVDTLFINKMCQTFMERAKKIMKKELHDMMPVGIDKSEVKEDQFNYFQKCCVSRSTKEILALAQEILEQASKSSEMCAGRLFYTAKQMFDLYTTAVPEYHKKYMDVIPQQVALFHNNCIYLSYELVFLTKYSKESISKLITGQDSFDDQVQCLSTAGTNFFSNHVRYQIKEVEEFLQFSDLVSLGKTEKMNATAEKSIRQGMRQLELLKTVWQRVLSYDLYNKTVGEIFNAFINYLMGMIVSVEDISSDNCSSLLNMFNIITLRGPQIFTEPKEINLFVKHWCKFKEIVLFFDLSLTDINDRWADGKGPLAMEFTPEEVRNLIRAVFQNTDRRAAVLSKIN